MSNVITTVEFLGTTHHLELADSTDYRRRKFSHTTNNRVDVIAAYRSRSVIVMLIGGGNLLGDPKVIDGLGLTSAVTHMTPDEARAIAGALMSAAEMTEREAVAA